MVIKTSWKPTKIQKLIPPVTRLSCSTRPTGRIWSIFFSETFRISYSHLVEYMRTPESGIGINWKNVFFWHDPLLEYPSLVIGLLTLYPSLNFLSCRIVGTTKMVHMKENGQAIRSNLRYFLSLLDHNVKSYSCFSVEHHIFALKCHPLSEPLEHTKNSNRQNLVIMQGWDFLFFI